MKRESIKIVLTFIVTLFFGVNVIAQQFKTHAVKKGETLEKIAASYNVSVDDILTYNKEIKKGQKLSVNTILIVPLDKKKPVAVTEEANPDAVDAVEKIEQEKPIRFISHKTKRKENLYRLSKEYNVTEEDIKRYNKTLYSEQLKKGMMLKIPVFKKEPTNVVTNSPNSNTNIISVTDPEPSGFSKYKVKKRETLRGIAQKFSVTEEQLKKHNRKLYSSRLKKGMVLKIPRYKKVEQSDIAVHNIPLKSYVVKPKETRWSIAHKFGITVDSLLYFNPELPRTTDYLGMGHELKIPEGLTEIKGKIQETVVTKESAYMDYKVPAGMTYYRIEVNHGISKAELIKLNPALKARGLQVGMTVKVPNKKISQEIKTVNTEINAENYIFYIVKQGQGEMALSRDLNVPYDEILKYNPELINGIKKGMVLKLPKFRERELNIKNSLVIPNVSLLDSINLVNRPNIVVMFPFMLDKLDANNIAKAKKGIKNSKISQYSLGLYSGMLVAADYVKELGVSVHIKTLDTKRDTEHVRNMLSLESLNGVGAVVGPIDIEPLAEVAKRAQLFNVPVVSPTASKGKTEQDNVFYSVPTDEVLRKKVLDYAEFKYNKENVIVVADSKSDAAKEDILERFPNAKTVGLIKDLTIDYENFERLLKKGKNGFL